MRRLAFSGKSPSRHAGRKWVAAGVMALLASALALGARRMPGLSAALSSLDEVFYDAFYRARPIESREGGDVVMVVVDDKTLTQMAAKGKAWPFPRDNWAHLVEYLSDCGARAIVFDLLFETPSGYAGYFRSTPEAPGQFTLVDDDGAFAFAIRQSAVPVVMSMLATPDGKPGPLAIKLNPKKRNVAAVNLDSEVTERIYQPMVHGIPSLAMQTLTAIGASKPSWAAEPFRMHFYGPHRQPNGGRTYKYISLVSVLDTAAAAETAALAKNAVGPTSAPTASSQLSTIPSPPMSATTGESIDFAAKFKGKIVLVGAISAATYDLKSSPLSEQFPGVEGHATAIDNMLGDRHVTEAGPLAVAAATFGAALLACLLVLLPRRAILKVVGGLAAAALVIGAALGAFRAESIWWLPLSAPLVALLFSTVGAFAWSYYTEDRNRRMIVKAFAQYVSPGVVAEIEKDPSRIRLTGDRHVMTVMFTDIEGFTSLSEKLGDEDLTRLLNFYFDEMSPLIFEEDGTLDKYIGDSIMSFWNAPIAQEDHAFRACRAALAMARRERQMQPELLRRGAERCFTRIGINTGPMVVGDMGSEERFNYTVLGDSVNLGSRLEGANKFYASTILMAHATAELVKDKFLIRRLDILRVAGKRVPMAVYELLGERRQANDEADMLDRTSRYEAAWEIYRRQDWDSAEAALRSLLSDHPLDGPAAKLLARVLELREHPPEPGWDGVYVAKGK